MSVKAEAGLQPVPHSIKVGAAGLLVLLIGAVFWFTTSSVGEESQIQDQAQSIIEIESPVQNLGAEIAVGGPVKLLDKINQTDNPDNESPSPDSSLNKQNEEKLSQLAAQLQQLSDEYKNRQQGQDLLHKDLQAQLTAQRIQIQQFQDNLKARQIAAAASTKKKAVKRYKKILPPFTLVSIDQWGNDLYAVVRSQGVLYELTHGQTVNGWTVDNFDRPGNTVSFKNKAGTRRELFIKL